MKTKAEILARLEVIAEQLEELQTETTESICGCGDTAVGIAWQAVCHALDLVILSDERRK